MIGKGERERYMPHNLMFARETERERGREGERNGEREIERARDIDR